jgi:hypothetical protein
MFNPLSAWEPKSILNAERPLRIGFNLFSPESRPAERRAGSTFSAVGVGGGVGGGGGGGGGRGCGAGILGDDIHIYFIILWLGLFHSVR